MGRKKREAEVFYNRIAVAIAAARKDYNEVAEYMGYTNVAISRWANNHTQPSVQDLFKLAEFLECTVFDLLESKPIKNPNYKKGSI